MVFEFYDSHADACRAVTKRVLFSKSMMLSGDAPGVPRGSFAIPFANRPAQERRFLGTSDSVALPH
jgi:hypothetical protein